MRGQYVQPIDDDMKEKFLDLVAQGRTRQEAAEALDGSARVFRSLCNPQSHRYDQEFAERYAEITKPEGEHHGALVERLRSAGIERALRSSDRLLEKYSVIYDPDWEVHKPQSMQINFNIDEFRQELRSLPDSELEAYVEKKKAELEAADVIDADE